MMQSINAKFNEQRNTARANNYFMTEAATEVEDVIGELEADEDDDIDVESVPEDAYRKVDKVIDELISSGNYDDEEIEDLVDEDEELAAKLGEVMDECANAMPNY